MISEKAANATGRRGLCACAVHLCDRGEVIAPASSSREMSKDVGQKPSVTVGLYGACRALSWVSSSGKRPFRTVGTENAICQENEFGFL